MSYTAVLPINRGGTAATTAARASIEAANSALIEGQLTNEQLEAKYPELWAVTS